MESNFFNFNNYREFLLHRFEHLKATKPCFSLRYFAKKTGVASPSYFKFVINGKRNLSPEYAEKFAAGLNLSELEKKCLITAVKLEKSKDQKLRFALLKKLEMLKKESASIATLAVDHVKILSDLITLKLYLLAQSNRFRFCIKWIKKQFDSSIKDVELEERINILLSSGLWVRVSSGNIKTVNPTVKTDDNLKEAYLTETHINILTAAKQSIEKQTSNNRIVGGRTFLINQNEIKKIKKRIDDFKNELEAEFESHDSANVYQLHLSFFELYPQGLRT